MNAADFDLTCFKELLQEAEDADFIDEMPHWFRCKGKVQGYYSALQAFFGSKEVTFGII